MQSHTVHINKKEALTQLPFSEPNGTGSYINYSFELSDNIDVNNLDKKPQKSNGALKIWEYEEVLNKIGFGKTQWLMLLITGLMTITNMSVQISMGIIVLTAQCEFNMTQVDKGIMMGACLAGIVVSGYFWGYIADILGRRKILIYTMFAVVVLQFAMMFVTNMWLFNAINLFVGVGLGCVTAVIFPYLSEFNTSRWSPIVINYGTMFVGIASVYVPATSWLVLSFSWSWNITEDFSFRPWRLIMLLNFLPGLIATLILLAFPESPKFLLAQANQERAYKAINWISKFNCGKDLTDLLDTSPIQFKPEELANSVALSTKGCGLVSNIFKASMPLVRKPHARNVWIAVVIMFCLYFSSSGMQTWYPEIVNRSSASGSSGAVTGKICDILEESFRSSRELANNTTQAVTVQCDDSISTKTFINNIIMGSSFTIGFAVVGTLLNPVGIKNVLLATLTISVICGILLFFITDPIGILVLFCMCILVPGVLVSVIVCVLVKLMPTHLRGKAVSLGFTVGKLGVIISSYMMGAMLEPYCNITFSIVTFVMLLAGILVCFLPI